MASSFTLFLLLITILSSFHTTTHARDSQFFNKIPATTNTNTNNVVVPNNNELITPNDQQQQPEFLPDNENGYGLYGHESGQLPPSTTTTNDIHATTTPYNTQSKQPLPKYLPKNYNPTAYVTQPENDLNNAVSFTEAQSHTTTNPNNNNNYYNNQREEESEYRNYPSTTTNTNTNNGNNYYSVGNSAARYRGGAALSGGENYNINGNNGGGSNGVNYQPQGMSDTRFVQNGKYFYDLNSEKYNENHPYESLRDVRSRTSEYNNNRNYNSYGNGENVNGNYEFNGESEFEVEDNGMP